MNENVTQMLTRLAASYLDEADVYGQFRAVVMGECLSAGMTAFLANPNEAAGRCDAQDAVVKMLDFMLDNSAGK